MQLKERLEGDQWNEKKEKQYEIMKPKEVRKMRSTEIKAVHDPRLSKSPSCLMTPAATASCWHSL